MDERIELTLDQFFKAECGEFFSLAQYEVQTGIFLSAFCKNMERIYSPLKIKNLPQDKKVLDSLVKILNSRLYLFEGARHGCRVWGDEVTRRDLSLGR